MGMDLPTRFQVVEFFKGVFVPFVSLNQVLTATYPQNPKTNLATTSATPSFTNVGRASSLPLGHTRA
jgi:hypothetical protein